MFQSPKLELSLGCIIPGQSLSCRLNSLHESAFGNESQKRLGSARAWSQRKGKHFAKQYSTYIYIYIFLFFFNSRLRRLAVSCTNMSSLLVHRDRMYLDASSSSARILILWISFPCQIYKSHKLPFFSSLVPHAQTTLSGHNLPTIHITLANPSHSFSFY